MRKTAVIVGNGKLHRDLSEIVDNAEFAMRFEEPKASIGLSGSRTDVLMLAASSKRMPRRLIDPAFLTSATFKAAKKIVLAYHPGIFGRHSRRSRVLQRLKGRRKGDWMMRMIKLAGATGKEIRIMPPQFYIDGCAELGVAECQKRPATPSVGFFGIRYVLSILSACEWEVKLCGFSWDGWKRHSLLDERRWVEDKMASGRISILA
ncbi:hypothetical protein RHSP_26896 [Rhizobium freirei PRF 81]|uniref:Uncharacterized protein n=1 Tax=Rhizobium freirei PRF 81 TaxID=363754 RepID=N6UB09_9HYPH|nr:hypothetical protein [Rhizobium freirei]ENN87373.1 hypothetical protein RHSP_26896 [Rhizobium freirei PRF 81]